MKVNWGCGEFPAEGWHNIDSSDPHADQLVERDHPFESFERATVETVYAGHVLEHIPWPNVVPILFSVRNAMVPGAPIVVVGPDIYKVLHDWHRGAESWEFVVGTLEGADRVWGIPEYAHWWDCHEQRVADALTQAGFISVEALPIDEDALDGWPVVAFTQWQFAVRGIA